MPEAWHILTPEFPPAIGGVGDYSFHVAEELARQGECAHIWAPAGDSPLAQPENSIVHALSGGYSLRGLRELDRELDSCPKPRRLFVQWVPHGYGYRSLNVPFCWWLWRRSRHDTVDLMIHEPFLMFHEGTWRQDAAAAVHRMMMTLVLAAASRLWYATPQWESRVRPWLWGRRVPQQWLPVPSNVVPGSLGPAGVSPLFTSGGPILGHFGTYGNQVRGLWEKLLPPILAASQARILLLGRDSEHFAAECVQRYPAARGRLAGVGALPSDQVSAYILASDLMMQPFTDGVSCRRSSAMAALAHGKALLTTKGKATEAIWENCGAAVLEDAADARGLANRAIALLADPAVLQRLGALAKDFYQQQFAVRRTVERLRGARS